MGRQLNFAHDAGPLFDQLPRLLPAPAPAPPTRGKGKKTAGKVAARRPEPVAVDRSDPKVARALKVSAKAIQAEDRAGLKAAKAQRLAEYDAQLMRLAELAKQLRSWVRRVKAAGAMEHLHNAPRIQPHAAAAFADLLHYD